MSPFCVDIESESTSQSATSISLTPIDCAASTTSSTPRLRHSAASSATGKRKPGANDTDETATTRHDGSIASRMREIVMAPPLCGTFFTRIPNFRLTPYQG